MVRIRRFIAALSTFVLALSGAAGVEVLSAVNAYASVSGSTHLRPGNGVSGVTQLCGPDAAYSCTTGGYHGQSTGWWGAKYGAGFASSNASGYHNCTLYAAYRVAQNGVGDPGWSGDAKEWAAKAAARGTRVDQAPAVGAVAQWNGGRAGHVAYVEVVTSSYIEITDDNYGLNTTDRFRVALNSPAMPDNFVHFKDVGGATGYEIGFQANTGYLYGAGDYLNGNLGQGMAPGTSPAVALLPGGGYEMAFHANTGNLFIFGDAGSGDTGQGMMAGTSPSIAASPQGDFLVTFQANTGNLYQYSSRHGAANLGQGMQRGTSPSVTAVPGGGYEIAFQANTGALYAFGDAGKFNTGQGMMSGTSPSIAASPQGGYLIAFQANTGNLYQYSSQNGAANLGQGMDTASSPVVAALAGGGYQMAFQANTHNLLVFGDAAKGDTGLGMTAGTSPAIAASPAGGFRAAMQANTGDLWTWTLGVGPANLRQGMLRTTSPCISSTLGAGCAPGRPPAPPAPPPVSKVRVGKIAATVTRKGKPVKNTWVCAASSKTARISKHRTSAGACVKTNSKGGAKLVKLRKGRWHLLTDTKSRRYSKGMWRVRAGRTTKAKWRI